jgi:hypothetical protein
MTIIKTLVGKNTSNLSLDFSGSPIPFSINPDSYSVGREVLDKATLYPVQNKTTSAFSDLTDYPQRRFGGFHFTPKVALTSMQDAHSTTYVNSEINAWSSIAPYQSMIGDRDIRLDNGTAFKFQDATGKTHYIVDLNEVSVATLSALNLRLLLIQGDDPTDPEAVVAKDFGTSLPTNFRGITAHSGTVLSCRVLCVDGLNKRVFFLGLSRNATYPWYSAFGIVVGDLTTIPVDGTLNITNLRVMAGQPIGTLYPSRYAIPYMDSFCGFNNDGDPIFMTTLEQDITTIGTSSGFAAYYRYWATPYGMMKNSTKHRVVFYKYNASTDNCTTLADLQGINSWGDGSGLVNYSADGYSGMCQYSGWIASPIAGEESVYYNYHLTCSRTQGWTPTMLRYKWDKSNDSFEVEQVSIDLTGSGETDIRNLYKHPDEYCQTDANAIQYNFGTNTVIFTKDSSDNYYLSMVTQFGSSGFLALAQANTGGNILSFSLNKTDMSSVTYHSHSRVDALRLQPVNANGDVLAGIHSGSAKLWSWSAGGFVQSVSQTGTFYLVTQDVEGNTWGVSSSTSEIYTGGTAIVASSKEFTMDVHLLSQDVPNSVSVAFEDATLSYNGSPLTKNIVVNAFDTSGSRISTSVVLKISGAVSTFQSNGLTTLTINTSDAGDTLVPLTITGAGFINVSASFAI